jgi:hypothetical protein
VGRMAGLAARDGEGDFGEPLHSRVWPLLAQNGHVVPTSACLL